jgi:hypothetical protein
MKVINHFVGYAILFFVFNLNEEQFHAVVPCMELLAALHSQFVWIVSAAFSKIGFRETALVLGSCAF